MVDVVLNRASLAPLYPCDGRQAAADIEALLRGLACLEDVVLRSHANLWDVPLVEGKDGERMLVFAEIVNSFYGTEKRHDVAEFFGELQRMAPTDAGLGDEQIERLLSCEITGPAPDLEATFSAVQLVGMDAIQCALTDSVLASLRRGIEWQCDRMGFVDNQIDRSLTFDHISMTVHGLAVAKRRREQVRSHLTSRNFWDLKEECYPHLRFGEGVETQIGRFSANLLGLAFKRLCELNEFSEQVGAGTLDLSREEKTRQGIKPETAQTMENYGEDRRFPNSNGALKIFEEHVWVDRLFRIHIFIHEQSPMIEIGYMGRHLRTMENRT